MTVFPTPAMNLEATDLAATAGVLVIGGGIPWCCATLQHGRPSTASPRTLTHAGIGAWMIRRVFERLLRNLDSDALLPVSLQLKGTPDERSDEVPLESVVVESSPGTAVVFGRVPDGLGLVPFRLAPVEDQAELVAAISTTSPVLDVGGQVADEFSQPTGLVRPNSKDPKETEMTVVPSPQLELNASDLAAIAGLMMITGGIALVMQHPAAQEAFRGLLQNPDVHKVVASIGRGLLDSLLKAVDTATPPPSAG